MFWTDVAYQWGLVEPHFKAFNSTSSSDSIVDGYPRRSLFILLFIDEMVLTVLQNKISAGHNYYGLSAICQDIIIVIYIFIIFNKKLYDKNTISASSFRHVECSAHSSMVHSSIYGRINPPCGLDMWPQYGCLHLLRLYNNIRHSCDQCMSV